MFEAAEIGSSVSKEQYEQRLPGLRVELINAQYDLRPMPFPVVVVVAGDDRLGCHDVLNDLGAMLDPRSLETHAYGAATDDESQRPEFWRYWRDLPANGRIGMFFGAWATRFLAARFLGKLKRAEFEKRIEDIRLFEQTLTDNGAILLKFWLHLPKSELKRRLKKARRRVGKWWRVGEADWRIFDNYDDALEMVEDLLRKTSTGDAPWRIVESVDSHYRNLTIAEALLAAIQSRLAAGAAAVSAAVSAPPSVQDSHTILDRVDLSATLDEKSYDKQLARCQARLNALTDRALARGRASVLVFEGWDAAGKGGTIRRVTQAIDASNYTVVPIAAPTDEEKSHHYLWRFWRRLPRAGHMTIFDRSWYGRVLVERVEGFARPDEWMRAYAEINDFEEHLAEHGVALLKFWLHIDPDEQLRRFKARENTPFKHYKITEEDYRNRGKRNAYEEAVNDMIARTSTRLAPWTIVPINDKRYGRIEVLRTICKRLA